MFFNETKGDVSNIIGFFIFTSFVTEINQFYELRSYNKNELGTFQFDCSYNNTLHPKNKYLRDNNLIKSTIYFIILNFED